MTTLPVNPNRFGNDRSKFGGNVITPAHGELCAMLNREHIPYEIKVIVERPGEFLEDGIHLKTYELDVLAWEKVDLEADGKDHLRSLKHTQHDEKRDAYLRSQGYVVLRFENEEIFKFKDWVMEKVRRAKPT